MKRKLVFATNNAHKLEEISAILGEKVELLSLKDINCHADIPETADTLEGNAMLKAEYIFENYGLDCFADDTGLEVEALNGAPGVWGKGYATEAASACLDYASDNLPFKTVYSFTAIPNKRSARVMQKIGMHFEKEFDHPLVEQEHWLCRHVLYKIEI